MHSSRRCRKPTKTRRREIAQAVLRVVGEQGAASLTAARIAAEVGVTSGALFRHFASLDAIWEAAIDLAIEQIDKTFPAPDLPPVDRLTQLGIQRTQLLCKNRGLAWLLLSDQVYLTVPAASVKRLDPLVKRSKACILKALREGAADGSLRNDTEPEILLVFYTGVIHALVGTARVRAKMPSARRVLKALFALLAPPPQLPEVKRKP